MNAAVFEKVAFLFVGLLVAVIAYFLKDLLASNKERYKESNGERHRLEKELHDLKLQSSGLWHGFKTELVGLDKAWFERHAKHQTQLELLTQTIQTYSGNISKLEGAIQQQLHLLSQQIAENKTIGDKLVKVFQYIDAKERATDAAQKKPDGAA